MIVGSAHPFCRRFDFSLFLYFLLLFLDWTGITLGISESRSLYLRIYVSTSFFFREIGKYVDILVKKEGERVVVGFVGCV